MQAKATIYEVFDTVLDELSYWDSTQPDCREDELVTRGDFLLSLDQTLIEAKRDWIHGDPEDVRVKLLQLATIAVRGLRDLGLPKEGC